MSLEKEFTEPYDNERALDGEDIWSLFARMVVKKGAEHDWSNTMGWRKKYWRMRPKVEGGSSGGLGALIEYSGVGAISIPKIGEGGWVKHDGSTICPIPWAKAGEFYADTGRLGLRHPSRNADKLVWQVVARWRLTDRWIPVLNGECPVPEAKAGKYEVKYVDGVVCNSCNDARYLYWSGIIAMRLLELDTGIDRLEEAVKALEERLPKPKTQSISACMEQALADVRDGVEKPGGVIKVLPETLAALRRRV